MKNQLRDKYLLLKLKKGHPEAFSQLYGHYVDKIYRFVYLKTFSKEDSEDITSQVFHRLLEYLGAEKQIEQLQAFLYQVARNLVIDFYRQRNISFSAPDYILEKVADEKIDPEARIDKKIALEKLALAMKDLNSDYRDVLILYYLDEMSPKEIAKIMEKTHGAVRVLIHRAIKALQGKINSLGEGKGFSK